MEKKKIISIVEVLSIILLVLIWGGPSGSIFGGSINVIDEGQSLAWLQHMLSGDKIYNDVFITYGPLYIYPLYFLGKILSMSVFIERVFFTASTLLGVIIASEIMKKLELMQLIRYLGLVLLLLFPSLHIRQTMGFLALYWLILCIQEYSTKRIITLGIISVLTFLVSPEIGMISILMCTGYLIYQFVIEKTFNFALKKIFFYLIGVVSSTSLFILWSINEGWFKKYLITTLDVFSSFSGVNLPNGKNFPSPSLFSPFTGEIIFNLFSQDILLYCGIVVYLIALFVGIKQLIVKSSFKNLTFILTVIFGFLLYQVIISRSGIGHFFFVLAPLIITLLYFLDNLLKFQKRSKVAKDKLLVKLIIFLVLLFLVRVIKVNLPAIKDNAIEISSFSFSKVNRVGPLKISQQQSKYFSNLQVFVEHNTSKDEKIFILSNEPILYFLLNRNNPTRFDLPYIAITKEKRYEMLSDLKKNQPTLILENTSDWAVDEVSNRRRLPEIVQFINQKYKKVTRIGTTVIYRKI